MLRWYYKHRIGDVYARCTDGKVRKCNIFGGNCLCVFTQFFKDEKTGKDMEQMLNFFLDENHLKRVMKNHGSIEPVSNITCIRLNTFYKEAFVLAKYFTKSGYKVTMYYKEQKESE